MRCAVIGCPIAHSLSPQLHREFAQAHQQSIEFYKLSCRIEDFNACINVFRQQGGTGLSVTLPFKQLAYRCADIRDNMAQLCKAANGLRFDQHGISATNSDGPGLVNDLLLNNIEIKDQRLLIIGAGGATQGIIPALLQQQPECLHLTNRSRPRLQQLLQHYASNHVIDHATNHHISYDLIINATSAGHFGHSPELQAHWFHQQTTAYDLSYGHAAEAFLTQCEQYNCTRKLDGLGMLRASAYLLYQWWRSC